VVDVRLTAEELIRITGVGSRQLGEWQELGLVCPDAGGRFDVEALERVRLIRFVVGHGVPAAEIARLSQAQGEDYLARQIEFLGPPRPPGCSLEEGARRAGLAAPVARRLWNAVGLGEEEIFDEDVEMMRAAASALRIGLPEEALVQFVRVMADALARVADAENQLFRLFVHEPLRNSDMPPEELVGAVRRVGEPLRDMVEPSVLYFHRRARGRALLGEMVVHLREDLDPRARPLGEVPVAVLFVDLASFTPMTEAMGDAEAAKVLERFSEIVRQAAGRCEGRVLKQIGDEFMVVFPSGAAAVACGRDIAHLVGQEPQFPAVRMGAHSGMALYREADYLGTTVNLAARVASEAQRGQMLVTDAIRAEAGEEQRFQPVGRRALKGVAEPLELYSVELGAGEMTRVIDPVCGMDLSEEDCDIRLSWRGADVYFCSDTCRERFLESPERYAVR
jgi:adenylate cyclase